MCTNRHVVGRISTNAYARRSAIYEFNFLSDNYCAYNSILYSRMSAFTRPIHILPDGSSSLLERLPLGASGQGAFGSPPVRQAFPAYERSVY